MVSQVDRRISSLTIINDEQLRCVTPHHPQRLRCFTLRSERIKSGVLVRPSEIRHGGECTPRQTAQTLVRRVYRRRYSYPLGWIRNDDTLLGTNPNSLRQERNVICIPRYSEWLWVTTERLVRNQRRHLMGLHTSPNDLKDNRPSCPLPGRACASFGRIASSAYTVTCRKLFTA